MKLKLPDVTFVMVETRQHRLGLLAAIDTLAKAEFADVLIFTDRPSEFSPLTQVCDPVFIAVDDWASKLEWCQFQWYAVPPHVRTRAILSMQWDAGIWDASAWRPEFLDYDFIGAPWWYPNRNVGNSGFCIKSTRIARFLRSHRADFPCDVEVEDDLLCRRYRPRLEEHGFRWAPERLAFDFAWEGCGRSDGPTKHFGFHAAQNFRHVFAGDDLLERARLMSKSIPRESYIWKNFASANPDVVQQIGDEAEDQVVVLQRRS